MKCEQQDDCEVAYVKVSETRIRLAQKGEECNLAPVKENCVVYKEKVATNLKK